MCRKFVKLVLLLFFCANPLLASLKFEKIIQDTSISAGTTSYAFTFPFKNIGNNDIKILSVSTTCSCTVANLDKKIYAPNESGEISGTFNIGNRVGLQEKEISLQTDDISQSQIKLFLKIKILNLVEFKPRLLYWKKDANPEAKNVEIKISDSKWKIESICCNEKNFTIKNVSENGLCKVYIVPISTEKCLRDSIKLTLKDPNGISKTFIFHALIK